MARPLRGGIDYFPMDVDFLQDRKVKLLKAEFGARGLVILLAALCRVYASGGYYAKFGEDDALLLADEIGCGCTGGFVQEVIRGCCRRDIFSEDMLDKYGILTSKGIQRRFLRAVQKRERIRIIEEYFLLDTGDKNDVPESILIKLTFNSFQEEKTIVSSTGNSIDSTDNTQSKVKESKVKYIRVCDDKAAEPPARTRFRPPSLSEVEAYCKQRKNGINASRFIDYYTANGWRIGRESMRDWRAAIRAWENNGRGNTDNISTLKRPAAAGGYCENTYKPGELDAIYSDIMNDDV